MNIEANLLYDSFPVLEYLHDHIHVFKADCLGDLSRNIVVAALG
jgi:hypothetical protein